MSADIRVRLRRTVSVGASPHLHIGYVKESNRVWVSNTGGEAITLLDATSGEQVGEFAVGAGPAHFAFDKGCRIGFVALAGCDGVAVVDPLLHQLYRVIALPKGSEPTGIMPAFERNRIYTLNQGNGTVSAIDTRTYDVTATIDVGGHPGWGQPWGSSYKPITKPVGKSYVVSEDSEEVTVFDDTTDRVLRRIRVGRRPVRNAIFREHADIYVANAGEDTVSVVPIADDNVAATVPVGVGPFRMLPVRAICGRDEMWVLNAGTESDTVGQVSIVDGAERKLVGTLDVVGRPINWVVNPAGQLFVVGAAGPQLCVVDIGARAVVGTASLPAQPCPGAVSGLVYSQSDMLFVLNSDRTVSVFEVSDPGN
jgi:YVTN family beta-propeller protein